MFSISLPDRPISFFLSHLFSESLPVRSSKLTSFFCGVLSAPVRRGSACSPHIAGCRPASVGQTLPLRLLPRVPCRVSRFSIGNRQSTIGNSRVSCRVSLVPYLICFHQHRLRKFITPFISYTSFQSRTVEIYYYLFSYTSLDVPSFFGAPRFFPPFLTKSFSFNILTF